MNKLLRNVLTMDNFEIMFFVSICYIKYYNKRDQFALSILIFNIITSFKMYIQSINLTMSNGGGTFITAKTYTFSLKII